MPTRAVLLVTLAFAACLTGTIEPGGPPLRVAVTPDTVRLAVGGSVALTVTVTDTAGTPRPDAAITFTSTAPTVVTVTADGVVTAVAPGVAVIVVEAGGSSTRVPVTTGLAFQALAVGGRHTCALTALQTLYCWGDNTRGQLGLGDRDDRLVPTRVAGTWSAVAAGAEQTCALGADRRASCWGRTATGDREQPEAVADHHEFRLLTVGGNHACGITTTNALRCWGANASGQLGDSTFGSRTAPVAPHGLAAIATASAGAAHTCAVDTAGRGWCWGANDRGQLAVDTVLTLAQPFPRRAADTLRFTRLYAGGTGFTCGLAIGGRAWCWGRGLEGQLGIDSIAAAVLRPAPVVTVVGDTIAFTTLALGWAHGCGQVVTGALACWGTSRLGQPGLYQSSVATTVASGLFGAAAGLLHTCAREASGRVLCWGGGEDGALGAGDRVSSDVPRPVALQLADPPG